MINLGNNLYNKFPNIYLSEDAKQSFALKRFFEILGGAFDEQENYIEELSNINNVDKCPASLLPLFAEMYGFEFPYDMDEATQRKFIKVIPFLYQYKGTDTAFKYLAREIFGEGTVTNTFSLSPPEGVTWEEWISDPQTEEDWKRLYVRLEVNGESLFLNDREVNFAKFAELIRPANKLVIPNLFLFYNDIRDKANTQENYALDWVKDNSGIFLYRFRDGSDRVTESEQTAKLILSPELDVYDNTKIIGVLNDSLVISPEYETRASIFYDELKLDTTKITDDDVASTLDRDDSLELLYKIKDTVTEVNEALKDDSYNAEISKTSDLETMNYAYTEPYEKHTVKESVLTETVNVGVEGTASTNTTVTRTTTLILGANKLVTNFRLTDYTPTELTLSY